MTTKEIPAQHNGQRATLRSLVAGIAIWFVYFNLNNALTSVACKWQWFPTSTTGLSALSLVEMVIALIAAILMLILIYIPWRDWRRFQMESPTRNPQLLHDTEKDRRPLLGFVVMLLNVLFLLIIVASLVPMITFNPCVAG